MMSRALAVSLILSLAACADNGTIQDAVGAQSGDIVFAAPQGVAVHERWVLVTNTAFDGSDPSQRWRPGFVTLIDRQSRQVVATIPTTQLNPVEVAVVDDIAYVLNTGTFEIGQDGVALVTSDGGIDLIDLGQSGVPAAVADNIPLPRQQRDARIGGYGSIAVGPDKRWAYLGSGTRGDVFQLDLRTRALVRGPDDPIVLVPTPAGENGLTAVRRLGRSLAVLDFNSDTLCVSEDWEAGLSQRRCESIGVSAELLEGPIDLASDDSGNALVLMSIANSLYRIDPKTSPFGIDHAFASTGLASNRIAVRGDQAYVVNSSSNNLQRVDLISAAWDLPFAVFPSGSNPFSLALSEEPEGPVAWVTLSGSDEIAIVSLDSGAVITRLGPRAVIATDTEPLAGRPPCEEPAQPVVGAVTIVSVDYGRGAGHGQQQLPALIQGGPTGTGGQSGAAQGVLSLGAGGTIVVDFGEYDLVDGPGPDFIVFENPFLGAPRSPFAEPAIVGVAVSSSEADAFVEFACELDEGVGRDNPSNWPYPGCAGVRPVLANVDENCLDPTDPQRAGGDAFDLADLGLRRVRYVRIRDAGVSPSGSTTRGFDLDAVVLIHAERR